MRMGYILEDKQRMTGCTSIQTNQNDVAISCAEGSALQWFSFHCVHFNIAPTESILEGPASVIAARGDTVILTCSIIGPLPPKWIFIINGRHFYMYDNFVKDSYEVDVGSNSTSGCRHQSTLTMLANIVENVTTVEIQCHASLNVSADAQLHIQGTCRQTCMFVALSNFIQYRSLLAITEQTHYSRVPQCCQPRFRDQRNCSRLQQVHVYIFIQCTPSILMFSLVVF